MIITDLCLKHVFSFVPVRPLPKKKVCYYWCCGNTTGCDTGVVMRIHGTYKKW